jgi:hypothetical protein
VDEPMARDAARQTMITLLAIIKADIGELDGSYRS